MAFLKERGNMFYACWYGAAGKKIVRATGIPVDASLKPGAPRESKAALKKKAATVADMMERADKEGMTLEAAQAALSAIISGNSKLPTVREYAEDYLRTHQNNSKQNDKKAISYFLDYLGPRADEPINHITAHDCKAFIQWRLTDPATRTAPLTVDRHRHTLSALFNRAVDQELLTRNPWKKAAVPKETPLDVAPNRRGSFTPDEIKLMIENMPGEWPDFIRLTIMCMGQRLGDMARLRWEQVDRKNNILHIRTGKTKANLDMPITYGMRDLLDRLEQTRVDEYIFPRFRVKYERSGKLSLEFKKWLIKLGIISPDEEPPALPGNMHHIAEKSFHSFRKTVVTAGRASGIAPDVMRTLVGHDSEEIQRAYFAPRQDYLAEQKTAIEKSLLPPEPEPPKE